MKLKYPVAALLLTLAFSGCSKKSDVSEAEAKVAEAEKQLEAAKKGLETAKTSPATSSASAPKAREYVLPVGTKIPIRTTTTLSTKDQTSGATFEASLREPLTIEGVELAPAGAAVSGVVVNSDSGGRVKGRASISIALRSITTKQGVIDIETNSRTAVAKSTVKRDVVRGGIMAGAGAAIGAIAGGGKGAAIGAGVGGGAGAGTAMATKGDPAVFGPESVLDFTLKSPVTVTVQP
jgi:hypothetical protein